MRPYSRAPRPRRSIEPASLDVNFVKNLQMDESVRQAMAKWPKVPACHGWLALDRRGRWRVRDEHAQQQASLGDVIRHPAMVAFIERNYTRDEHGAWFFQNGPQRVFVDVEAAPLVLFGDAGGTAWRTHHGHSVQEITAAYVDELGRFWAATDLGPASISDRDFDALLAMLVHRDGTALSPDDDVESLIETNALALRSNPQAALVQLNRLNAEQAPSRLGFIARPRATTESLDR